MGCYKEGTEDDERSIEELRRPLASLIEVNGKFHEFFLADLSHVQLKDIYFTLDNIYL